MKRIPDIQITLKSKERPEIIKKGQKSRTHGISVGPVAKISIVFRLFRWAFNRFQRLNAEVNVDRRMRILFIKSTQQTLTNHTAVFIVCLRQHKDKLRNAALGDDISLAEIGKHR